MNPSCTQCRQLASALYDDALPLETRAALLEHLATCSACRLEYRTLEAALAALAGLGDTQTSPDFERRLVRDARNLLARERLMSWGRPVMIRRGRLIALAGLLVVCSLVFGIWVGQPGSTDPEAGRAEPIASVPDLPEDPAPLSEKPSAEEQEQELARHVARTLEGLGFVRKGDGSWRSPLEARVEAEGLCLFEGELVSPDEVRARLRSELIAEQEATAGPASGADTGGEPEVAGPPGPTTEEFASDGSALSQEEFMAGVKAYLLEQGFVERKGHWYSETESRLLEPGMACIGGRILTREKLKEELKTEILGDAGFVLNSAGKWVIKASVVTGALAHVAGATALEAGDRYWAPEPAIVELDGGDSRRVERTVRNLRASSTRAAALRALSEEGPRVIGALKSAYEAANGSTDKKSEERLALGRVLAWNGVETPEIVEWVEQVDAYYKSAKPGKNRLDRYQESITILDEIGLMSGRILARSFERQPTLRTAELLSNFQDPAAEMFLLDVFLRRPGAPESEILDLHPDFLDWWIDRRVSGEPVIFDRAVALLNRSDERELLVGVHLLEAIAYRYPEWAERVTDELLAAAESSFCGCSLALGDSKSMTATFADCRLHEDVTLDNIKTSSMWTRDADLTLRGRTRTFRGAAVAADIGRVLSNLTAVEHSISFKGDRSGDLLAIRDRQKVAMHNWRLQYRQHRADYVQRWQRMMPGAAAFRESELRAPWHLRNSLRCERTDLRATFADPDLGFVGMKSVLSDHTTLKTVILRFLGEYRGGRINSESSMIVPVRSPEGLPASLTTSMEFYALGVPLLDGLNLALEPRGLVALFEEGSLYIGPLR